MQKKERKKKNSAVFLQVKSNHLNQPLSKILFPNPSKLKKEILNKKQNYQKKIKEDLMKDSTLLLSKAIFYKKFAKFIINLMKLTINILGIFFYSLRTFVINKQKINLTERELIKIELIVACFYFLEAFNDFFMSPSKNNHIFSINFILDILTISPGFLYLFFGFKNKIIIALSFLRSLRIFRIFDIIFELIFVKETMKLRSLEVQHDKILEMSDKVLNLKTGLFQIISHFFCIIFISTDIFLTIQQIYNEKTIFNMPNGEPGHINPFQALYFVIVTLTTLGYGDFVPNEPIVRIFLTLILIFYIAIVSRDISLISEKLKNFSAYDTHYGLKDHIIIIGEFSSQDLKQMLNNFYLELDQIFHDINDLKILIVKSEDPSIEINCILDDIAFINNVKYLKADINKVNWAHKASLENSLAVFAFADKPSHLNEDQFRQIQENIIYICKSIKNSYPDKMLFLYMHFAMHHWRLSDWLQNTHVFYSNLFKNFFLGVSIENKFLFYYFFYYYFTLIITFLLKKKNKKSY